VLVVVITNHNVFTVTHCPFRHELANVYYLYLYNTYNLIYNPVHFFIRCALAKKLQKYMLAG